MEIEGSGSSNDKASDAVLPYLIGVRDNVHETTIISYGTPLEEGNHGRTPLLFMNAVTEKMAPHWPRLILQLPTTDLEVLQEYEFPTIQENAEDTSPLGAKTLYRVTMYYLGLLFETARKRANREDCLKMQSDFIRDMRRHWVRLQRRELTAEQYITLLRDFHVRFPKYAPYTSAENIIEQEQMFLVASLEKFNLHQAYVASLTLPTNVPKRMHPLGDYAWSAYFAMAKRIDGEKRALVRAKQFDAQLRHFERAFNVHGDHRRFATQVRDIFQYAAPWALHIDIVTEFDKACFLKTRAAFLEIGAHWAEEGDGCDGCEGEVVEKEVMISRFLCDGQTFCMRCDTTWTESLGSSDNKPLTLHSSML